MQNQFVIHQHGKSQRAVNSDGTDGNCSSQVYKKYING